jgi:hypothetical protein
MKRSQLIIVMTALCLGLVLIRAAWADSASDVCAALANARSALYSMMITKDRSAQDTWNAKVQAASTKLDLALDTITGDNAKKAADFKAVWDQFKATREQEVIPAIYSGNPGDARKIVDGVQADRLSKMWGIMSCKVR